MCLRRQGIQSVSVESQSRASGALRMCVCAHPVTADLTITEGTSQTPLHFESSQAFGEAPRAAAGKRTPHRRTRSVS